MVNVCYKAFLLVRNRLDVFFNCYKWKRPIWNWLESETLFVVSHCIEESDRYLFIICIHLIVGPIELLL